MNDNRVDSALCKAHPLCEPITPVNYCAGVDYGVTAKLCRAKARWTVGGPGRKHRYCTRHAAELIGNDGWQELAEPHHEPARGLPLALTLSRPRSGARVWLMCCEGNEPAEALSTRDREDLVWHLVHELGWTDREVAAHTRMTDYTAARIRDRLGLKPNQSNDTTAAA